MVGQPTDEESSNKCSHHFEWFGGFHHPVGAKSGHDDRVADEDYDERDDEPCEEAAHCNYLVTVL